MVAKCTVRHSPQFLVEDRVPAKEFALSVDRSLVLVCVIPAVVGMSKLLGKVKGMGLAVW